MKDIKELIINELTEKKHNTIQKLDNDILTAQNTMNFIDMYNLLIDIYGNSLKQAELQVELLKENLTSEFFKNATVKKLANNISFSDEKYTVLFPTSRIQKIEVRLNNNISKPYYHRSISDVSIELHSAMGEYFAHKSIKTFKRMADINGENYLKNPLAQIVKYINSYKKCTKEIMFEIEEGMNRDKYNKEQHEKNMLDYLLTHADARTFVYELYDLQLFKDKGYTIWSKDIANELGEKPFGGIYF